MNAGFQLHRTAFYDTIAGQTEFILSIINSVKIVTPPYGGKKSSYIIILYKSLDSGMILFFLFLNVCTTYHCVRY